MNTYIIIGGPGQGKSEFVKTAIQGRRCFVFDIQNEYGARTKYKGQKPLYLSDNINEGRSRYTGVKLETFQELVLKKRDTICVFEEATMFFEGRTSGKTREIMINRFHTGNVYMFLFHSINSVPPRIMEMSNYVVLHKTLDEDHNVMYKYSRLYTAYSYLKDQPNGSRLILKLI